MAWSKMESKLLILLEINTKNQESIWIILQQIISPFPCFR